MIFSIGAFFWILALVAVVRILYANRKVLRKQAWLWALLTLMACVLLFRPHEDIFGGEDPGSYVNSGVTYGQKGALFYQDPLLALVPLETRSAFYYGHSGYGTTKNACLWVVNTNAAVVGPHFQPAYPLLVGAATQLGANAWALYVVPLFALFTGFVLMTLASRLLAHRLAGLIAFACYLLNPLTLWHARCARPEIIAGFMFFAGISLLLLAWHERGRSVVWDILLGALCIGAAPFFHITALSLAIPTALAIGLIILRGRTEFLIYPLIALGMLLLFYGQAKYVTDYYHVQRFFNAVFNFWPLWTMGLAGLAGIGLVVRHRRTGPEPTEASNTPHAVPDWLAAALAFAGVLFLVNIYFNREGIGSLPIMGKIVANYNILTDWQTFANMVSWPTAILALVGWVVWLTGDRTNRPERIGLGLITFPALVLAGTMRDFMMTRYMLMAIIPMAALSLTALATRLPEWPKKPWTAWLAPGLAAIICLAGLAQRGHLITLVEHRGLLNFLAPFAQTIQQDRGILLGEYSRLTAPLEHIFGVTALSLDNERRDDYSAAERAWETIMRKHPEQQAFFMTPFQTPRSDRFDFSLVKQAVFEDRKIQQAYNTLPTNIQEMQLTLSLYKMTLKADVRPATLLTNVVELPIESGNMGLRRFINLRSDKPVLEGIALATGEQVSLAMPGSLRKNLHKLVFLMQSSDPCPMAPAIGQASALPPEWSDIQFHSLKDTWWFYSCRPTAGHTPRTVAIAAWSPLFLAAAWGITDTNTVDISANFSKTNSQAVMPPLKGRWARADAAILAPATAPGARIFMLVYAPALNPAPASPTLTLIDDANSWKATTALQPGKWQWLSLSLPPGKQSDNWIHVRVDPAWNPQKAGFPPDLGVFFGRVVVAP